MFEKGCLAQHSAPVAGMLRMEHANQHHRLDMEREEEGLASQEAHTAFMRYTNGHG